MDNIGDLDLHHLDTADRDFIRDPFPYIETARRKHPWLARSELGYVVHEYSAIKDLLEMDDRFQMNTTAMVEILGAKGTNWGRFQTESMQGRYGETHKRMRDAVNPWFTPRQANLRRDLMRSVISELLDEWVPKGAFDFEEFAAHFPITVMCGILGVSPDVVPGLKSALEAFGMSANFDRDYVPKWVKATEDLEAFAVGSVEDRRKQGRKGGEPDLLDRLIEARARGDLTERELLDLIYFVFVGGYDTSKNLLTRIMYLLLDRPEEYRRCADDLEHCARVVEETMRYAGQVTTFRTAVEDVVYRDVLLPKGTLLFLTLSTAGRDPRLSADANEFNPDRQQIHRHMGFGRGPHICLGQFIARVQVQEGLNLVAQRIANPRLAGPVGYRPFLGAWGLEGLPIEFDPAPASTAGLALASH